LDYLELAGQRIWAAELSPLKTLRDRTSTSPGEAPLSLVLDESSSHCTDVLPVLATSANGASAAFREGVMPVYILLLALSIRDGDVEVGLA